MKNNNHTWLVLQRIYQWYTFLATYFFSKWCTHDLESFLLLIKTRKKNSQQKRYVHNGALQSVPFKNTNEKMNHEIYRFCKFSERRGRILMNIILPWYNRYQRCDFQKRDFEIDTRQIWKAESSGRKSLSAWILQIYTP